MEDADFWRWNITGRDLCFIMTSLFRLSIRESVCLSVCPSVGLSLTFAHKSHEVLFYDFSVSANTRSQRRVQPVF